MKSRCLLLLASIFVVSAGARADSVGQDGILRDAQGRVLTMNQADAVRACAKHGMQLPTIRELVKLSQSAGITLKEPNKATEGEIRIGAMKPVSAVNPNGKTDRFYYSNDNYTRPSGDLGSHWFWSSSDLPGYSLVSFKLDGGSGDVEESGGRVNTSAVRCVVGE